MGFGCIRTSDVKTDSFASHTFISIIFIPSSFNTYLFSLFTFVHDYYDSTASRKIFLNQVFLSHFPTTSSRHLPLETITMAGDTSTSKADAPGLFPYAPSEIGAILFAGLFGLSTIYHLFQMIRGRAWFYTAFVIGALSTSPLLPSLPQTPTKLPSY
jgi:hypothetical protein